jgi:hypothetical protein
MHQQLWGYKVEEKLYVGVREQKSLNTADLENCMTAKELSSLGQFETVTESHVSLFAWLIPDSFTVFINCMETVRPIFIKPWKSFT